MPFAERGVLDEKFPSTLNGRNIYINATAVRSGNTFVAWFWWLKRTMFISQDGFIENFEN